jgi:hypothetical protein
MSDAWIAAVGAGAVAIISLAGAIYFRSKQVSEIGVRLNQAVAILSGAAVAVAATRFANLDWYFAIPLGMLAFVAIRLPAYSRHAKNVRDNNREIPN